MASADARPHVDHTGLYRGILGIAVVGVPAFGLLEWDLTYDWYPMRLIFAAAALAVLVASYRSLALRRRLRLATLLLCYALFLWFTFSAWRHNMALEDILGLLPVVTGVGVLARRPGEIVFFIAFVAAVLAVVYANLDAPAVGFSVPIALFAVFSGVLGWMSVWRTRLEEALQDANATLEARVARRTALLEREIAERIAAERRANAANEAKSRFLANMSHELRTPLNAVIGYTELVDEELAGTDQAHHCEDLDKVSRAARHLLTIIDNILDLSRIEAGPLSLASAAVAVGPAVDDAAVMIQPAIAARGNRLEVAVEPDLAVLGDRDALVRVLVHLLENAAKFTAGGAITIAATRAGGEVAIAIRDTGIGIPEAARSDIFQRFTQADESTPRLHGGAGLGLAICKELVARMRGTIAVDSALGEGSTFTLRLPAA